MNELEKMVQAAELWGKVVIAMREYIEKTHRNIVLRYEYVDETRTVNEREVEIDRPELYKEIGILTCDSIWAKDYSDY